MRVEQSLGHFKSRRAFIPFASPAIDRLGARLAAGDQALEPATPVAHVILNLVSALVARAKAAMTCVNCGIKKRNPNASVRKILDKLDKDKPVYCHCRSGRRVLTAAPLLKKMGFDIRPLKAGFDELRENGFKVANP